MDLTRRETATHERQRVNALIDAGDMENATRLDRYYRRRDFYIYQKQLTRLSDAGHLGLNS